MKKIGECFIHEGLDGADVYRALYEDDNEMCIFVNGQRWVIEDGRGVRGLPELTFYETWATEDCNHPGVVFESRDKNKLQNFAEALSEEGSCMTPIKEATYTESVICDIDKEWNGKSNVNPFYFWYYGAEDAGPIWNKEWSEHRVFNHAIANDDGDMVIEPGYFGVYDANYPSFFELFDNEAVAQAVAEYYNADGCACFVVAGDDEDAWKQRLEEVNKEEEEKKLIAQSNEDWAIEEFVMRNLR